MVMVGSPAVSGTLTNGNQPRNSGTVASGVSEPIWPAFQWPMSSMAALPLATRPAELSAPCWPEVARNPSWKGSVPTKSCSSSPASTQHGSLKSSAGMSVCSVSVEHAASANWYHQWAAGHRSAAPTAMGAVPAAFSLLTASSSSGSVVGGVVIPASSKSSVLYQNPSMPNVYGSAYCFPSTCHGFTVAPSSEMVSDMTLVRSLRWPA